MSLICAVFVLVIIGSPRENDDGGMRSGVMIEINIVNGRAKG